MKKITTYLLAMAMGTLCAIPAATSQKNTNASGGGKTERVIKTVNGCDYEVLSGLAEVVSIEKIVNANKSPLQYDEYEVQFKFIPMEGGEMMSSLRDVNIPLMLKYKQHPLRVGPEYLKAYHVRVGLKYAMKLLQNRNGECAEKYTYESGGLPNDLFEARPRLADFEQDIYAQKLGAKEADLAKDEFDNTTNPNSVPDTEDNNTNTSTEPAKPDNTPDRTTNPVVQPPVEPQPNTTDTDNNTGSDTGETPNTSGNPSENPATTTTTSSDPSEAALREQLQKELEAQIRRELEEERIRKEQEAEAARKAKEDEDRRNAVKVAKEKAKEEERKKKEEEERLRLEAEARKAKEEALKAQIRAELESKLRDELRQKELEDQQRKADEERKRLEEERQKQEALAREEAVRKAREAEAQRANCAYQEKVSGVIEVMETKKTKEAGESVFGYAEYEVIVRFTPDNFDDIPKKDRAVWEKNHLFILDAKGKSANPGARYIRQFNVFKGAKYKGFAQQIQSGICSELMLFSPDLPADVSQVKP